MAVDELAFDTNMGRESLQELPRRLVILEAEPKHPALQPLELRMSAGRKRSSANTHLSREDVEERLVERVVERLRDLVDPDEALDGVDEPEPEGLLETLAAPTAQLTIGVHRQAIAPKDERTAQPGIRPAVGLAVEGRVVYPRGCGGDDLRVGRQARLQVTPGAVRHGRCR